MANTNNYKIYYPSPSDTALAQTQMAMLAASVDNSLNGAIATQQKLSDAIDGRLSSVEALAGIKAGAATDATTSSYIQKIDSLTRKAMDKLYATNADLTALKTSINNNDSKATRGRAALSESIDGNTRAIGSDMHLDIQKKMAYWIQHQNDTGIGIVVLGSSTAEGYGSVTFGREYDGHSWVERMSSALTENAIIKDNTAAGSLSTQKKPATGIQVWNLARGGTTSADYLPQGKINLTNNIQPEIVIHAIGSNNYNNQWGTDDYEKEVLEAINKIKAVSPNSEHILVSYQTVNNKSGNKPPIKWWQYNDVLRKIAESEAQVHYFDLSVDSYTMGMPGLNHWWYYQTDGNHVLGVTHRHYANRIMNLLGLPHPPDAPEIYEWENPIGGNKNAGATIMTRSVGKRAWPRKVVTQGTIYGNVLANKAAVSIKLQSSTGDVNFHRLNTDSTPVNIPVQMTTYVPAGVVATITMSVDGPGGTQVYSTSSGDWFDINSVAYMD